MTKVSILGEEPKARKLKKIEFTHCLMEDCKSFNFGLDQDWIRRPKDMDEIILLPKNLGDFDVFLCKKDGEHVIYFGHYNDGGV